MRVASPSEVKKECSDVVSALSRISNGVNAMVINDSKYRAAIAKLEHLHSIMRTLPNSKIETEIERILSIVR